MLTIRFEPKSGVAVQKKTSRYVEFNSNGPGANSKTRVGWARRLSANEARVITAEKVLGGFGGWNPKTR